MKKNCRNVTMFQETKFFYSEQCLPVAGYQVFANSNSCKKPSFKWVMCGTYGTVTWHYQIKVNQNGSEDSCDLTDLQEDRSNQSPWEQMCPGLLSLLLTWGEIGWCTHLLLYWMSQLAWADQSICCSLWNAALQSPYHKLVFCLIPTPVTCIIELRMTPVQYRN